MNNVSFFSRDGDDSSRWQRGLAPPYVSIRDGVMLLKLPRGSTGLVNGLPVLGLQVLQPGDQVRLVETDGEVREFLVGQVAASHRVAAGVRCDFSGLPLEGEALACACGANYSLDILEELDRCPCCTARFANATEPLPAEELL